MYNSAFSIALFIAAAFTIIVPQSKTAVVFIRIDDVYMRESNIEPMEANYFLTIAEKHGARVMLAVIPARLLQKTNNNGRMSKQLRDYVRRGHQLVQHGFNHRCSKTNSTSWEYYTPQITPVPKEKMVEQIRYGKWLLETATKTPVTAYVGPGNDNDFVLNDGAIFHSMGFLWLTDQKTDKPYLKQNKAYFFSLDDYAWALNDSNYAEQMNSAKAAFIRSAKTSGYFGILFHDHFTRQAYNDGITIRWLDEYLEWLENDSGYRIQYRTCDQWYEDMVRGMKK
jgi:peptidoglycan/xylan/chitin deacetylase (PgdA/CDA1 family)